MSAPSNNKLKEQIRDILLQHENYDNSSEEISNVASGDCLEKLAAGLMTFYEPELKRFREQLAEVVNKQNTLIEQLQDENKRFVETQNAEELQGMFTNFSVCNSQGLPNEVDGSEEGNDDTSR